MISRTFFVQEEKDGKLVIRICKCYGACIDAGR